MSYTTNIKNEIINNYYTLEENMAELSAILNIEAEIGKKDIKVYTENIGVSRRIYTLIKETYAINPIMTKSKINRLGKKYLIEILINEKKDFILKDLSITDENGKRLHSPKN